MIGICLTVCSSICAIRPDQIQWHYRLGTDPADKNVLYSLLSLGAIKGEISDDFEQVRRNWICRHAGAVVVPVIIRQPLYEREPESKMIFVWIVDGRENLNVELVRRGCVAAAAMFSNRDRAFNGIDLPLEAAKDRLEVSEKAVRERLLQAEAHAHEAKAGIWAPAAQNRRDD
jgi:hypothetical protein